MKKILYIDLDNVLVDFESAFPHLSKKVMTEYEGRLDEVPGIFSLMEPMPSTTISPAMTPRVVAKLPRERLRRRRHTRHHPPRFRLDI